MKKFFSLLIIISLTSNALANQGLVKNDSIDETRSACFDYANLEVQMIEVGIHRAGGLLTHEESYNLFAFYYDACMEWFEY